MKTIAGDVDPTVTPSIGSGNASATAAAASRHRTPASAPWSGGSPTTEATAAAATTAPASATGTTTGKTRAVLAAESADQRGRVVRLRERRISDAYVGLSTMSGVPIRCLLPGGRNPGRRRRLAVHAVCT